jgi:hypothetical protein
VRALINYLPKYSSVALGLMGVLALSVPSATALNLGVSPSRFELKINSDKSRTETIRVLNLDSRPVELKVSVRSWVFSENNKVQTIPPSEQSLEQWIVLTPSRFTIPAGGAQTIRFAIRPRVQPQAGEHRAMVLLEEIPSGNSKSKGVRVIGRLGVAVYAYVGDIKRSGVLNSVTVDTKPKATQAIFDVSSEGNGYVRFNGQYAIWPAAQYPGAEVTKPIADVGKPTAKIPENILEAGLLPDTPVLPNNRRRIQLPIKKTLPPGQYVLDIKGDLSGKSINQGIPFTVPKPKK